MANILVTGAAGQIGSELVPALRQKYGGQHVVAAGNVTKVPDDLLAGGPCITIDITDPAQINRAVVEFDVETIYHLSSILSALAEQRRGLGHDVNINGLYNVLEAALAHGVRQVIVPSSIGAFGPDTPHENTPTDTITRPNTLYGISKVFGELMGDYYFEKLGLDVRGLRLPGIISWKTEPTAGTTDYAVAIFYEAIRKDHYVCYLSPDTRLPMMYMPDAIHALIQLAEADLGGLQHHSNFNVSALSFTPAELANVIRARKPDFTIEYEIDPLRQAIADSWSDSMDDSDARKEWGWEPRYNIERMADDMLENLREKLKFA